MTRAPPPALKSCSGPTTALPTTCGRWQRPDLVRPARLSCPFPAGQGRGNRSGWQLVQNLGLDPGQGVGQLVGAEVPVGQDELVEAEFGVLPELIDDGRRRTGERGPAGRGRG